MNKFLLDSHLGKLARWLRMLGYDTVMKDNPQDPLGEFVWQARMSGRIPVTARKQIPRDLRSDLVIIPQGPVVKQLRELKERGFIDIPQKIELSQTRCSLCNASLMLLAMSNPQHVKIISTHPDVKKGTLKFQSVFYSCTNPDCGKMYWEGIHWERIKHTLRKARE